MNHREFVEVMPSGMAALCFGRLVPGARMRVTRIGGHADYWLPELRCALEVSGTVSPRDFSRRHRQKVRQVLSNPLGWNGYVFLCCLAPRRRVIHWSYHEQEAQAHAPS